MPNKTVNLSRLVDHQIITFPIDNIPLQIADGVSFKNAGNAKLTVENSIVIAIIQPDPGIDPDKYDLCLGGQQLPIYDKKTGIPTGENHFHLTYLFLISK